MIVGRRSGGIGLLNWRELAGDIDGSEAGTDGVSGYEAGVTMAVKTIAVESDPRGNQKAFIKPKRLNS